MTLEEKLTPAERRGSRAICMPVGPLGIKPSTAQMVIALIKRNAIDAFICHESHLIPARNAVWTSAIDAKAKRVLWVDSDIYVDHEDMMGFMNRADEAFAKEERLAWVGAVCKRRGGGLAMLEGSPDQYPVLMGLGVAYWHVDRMIVAIGKSNAFVWVPPFGEDYRACISVWDADMIVKVDRTLPTEHLDVGSWRGGGEP